MSYNTWKEQPLEWLFNDKHDLDNPQDEYPFTRQEVAQAILAVGEEVRDNHNNFVKDLTRGGNANPRNASAEENGYLLRESTSDEFMGVFFKDDDFAGIALDVPEDLEVQRIDVQFPEEVFDLIRYDEGGILSAVEYSNLLVHFFDDFDEVLRVQTPVKLQPHEIDSLFVAQLDNARVLIPCEAKSQGGDAITLNQIEGIAETALTRFSVGESEPSLFGNCPTPVSSVIPLGIKLLSNGDVYMASFPELTEEERDHLQEIVTADNTDREALYRLNPMPPGWGS